MSSDFQRAVIEYYHSMGRPFFWREESLDTFEWLLVELLLKRTSANTVNNHGKTILRRFSHPKDVMSTPYGELVEILRPFGLYNRRSKNLKNICATILSEHAGAVPREREVLLQINGIGEYIADALMCFGFGEPVLVLDTNTALIAREFFAIDTTDDLRLDENIRPTLEPLVPATQSREFNWGLLDIGTELRRNGIKSLPDLPVPNQ